ncbi:PC4-domain-containing protein [Patellaria atrata CBS 101060]|uniref:PC4-domain-containing protein n=1 Tax=Patellaria atrata CBS 101060 TaxID=1346257 RepID=A0A9P4S4X6_9PEZI|nr:PC4-domain-containing protein [Patellaria atrata CBS 101060]
MAPRVGKRKSQAESYESDGGFVEDAPKSKKSKTTKGASKAQVDGDLQIDDDGNEYFMISKLRRVTISEFKGNRMVNIREYYEKDGKLLPGKKGISLPMDQYTAFIAVMPKIEEVLTNKGETVPRPDFSQPSKSQASPVKQEEGEDEDDNVKKNFEATSDEEE